MIENVKEAMVDALMEDLYRENARLVRPMFPWILLRVCKREQQVGSIVLSDIEQNKPVHEGIVLSTWAPFTKETGTTDENGVKVTRSIEMRSKLEPGDHVLFQHWAGQPVHGFNDQKYRVVKECDWEYAKDGGIFALVEYSKVEDMAREKIRRFLGNYMDDKQAAILAANLEDQFVLVDRDVQSVTLSGR